MATQLLGRELSNREFFIQRWEQQYLAFMRVFKALPTNRLDYRPHPRSAWRKNWSLSGLFGPAELYSTLQKSEKFLQRFALQDPASFGNQEQMIPITSAIMTSLGITWFLGPQWLVL